jgi:hypothetical protein
LASSSSIVDTSSSRATVRTVVEFGSDLFASITGRLPMTDQTHTTAFDCAGSLWDILDDIDTADDACKGDDAAFRQYVRKAVRRRFECATTDGYDLIWRHVR